MGSYLKKLFGKKETEKDKAALPVSADPSRDPKLIQVFDSYGREMFITREQWRDDVLPGSIKNAWNKPDDLYAIIYSALNDGFRSAVVDAAKQLYKIDPDRSRGTCVWAVVLREEGRLEEAEKVIRDYLAKHGEDGVVLTNLAKIYAQRKNHAKAEEILWHALELDPNQDNGMGWYQVIHRERGGDAASQDALRRIAALPGSWRAQLWLARAALQSRQLERALDYYRDSLSRVSKPVPTDVLRQISGDLGKAAHLPELLALTEPFFDPAVHGVQVGNNLIKAHCDLGQLEAARRILDQLYALKRPDWREALNFWETEIAKTNLNSLPHTEIPQVKIAMLTVQGPVWLKPESPAAELFPAKLAEGPLISFLGSSAEVATNSQKMQHQLADTPGRLSRALPLFLAEQIEFGTAARVQTLVPWLVSDARAFVLSGVQWSDDDATNYAKQGEAASNYVVTVHLKTQLTPWVTELRIVRIIDSTCLAELHAEFLPATPEVALPDLAHRLLKTIAAETHTISQPKLYQFPTGAHFQYYLLRLEQLLAVRCSAMDGVQANFLTGERDIIDGNIQLCLASSESLPARLLLANTLLSMKRVRPDIIPEFRDKVALLQNEKPLPEPSHSVVQRIIDEALKKQEPQK